MPAIVDRIYNDFFMSSRLEEYRIFLETSLACGYEICSIAGFWQKIKFDQLNSESKYLILRHDIDTGLHIAKDMWKIEISLNIKSSYYFRLSTIDIPFMQEISRGGSEASYHFEELATIAKQMNLRTKEQIISKLYLIRELFKQNLIRLRQKTGIDMNIVASHGDFVNRKLGIYNWEILSDEDFRNEIGIDLEVYDEKFMRFVTSRHSDTFYPLFWKPKDPINAILENNRIVYVLVHPRYWMSSPQENLIDYCQRILEGWRYS